MTANTNQIQTYTTKEGQFFLPPIDVLKPITNTNSGVIDMWPAHAANTGAGREMLVVTRSKRLQVVDDGRPDVVPKPKFLQKLESYLENELVALGVTEAKPSELRLQVHREVFEYLIEDFRTYRGLLAAIKSEYEMMLSALREKIRELEPLRQLLATVSEQAEQRIMEIQNKEKHDLLDMQGENARLANKIQDMRNDEVSFRRQIHKLQEDLAAEYLRYRDECDARKLLIGDINDLRFQQEEAMAAAAAAQQEQKLNPEMSNDLEDDPKLMKIALRKAREAEARATKELNRIEADYQDVVPRRDFEMQRVKLEEVEATLATTSAGSEKLQEEHKILLELYDTLKTEAGSVKEEFESLQRSATPRPVWQKCAGAVYGGAGRWQELSANKRSDELVDVLLEELKKGGGGGGDESVTFPALGTADNVPPYLRYDGQTELVNRRLGKRDLLFVIRDIWSERAQIPVAERTQPLDQFVTAYLLSHFPLKHMAFEWGYNMHAACQRFFDDDEVKLFFGVLRDEVDEDQFHREKLMIASLATKLGTEPASESVLRYAIQELCPYKIEADVETLSSVARKQTGITEGDIPIGHLFSFNEEGAGCDFLVEFSNQLVTERQTYVEEILKELGEGFISASVLQNAIQTVDPDISDAHLQRYLCWAYACSPTDLSAADPVVVDDLKDRLLVGSLYRTGRGTT